MNDNRADLVMATLKNEQYTDIPERIETRRYFFNATQITPEIIEKVIKITEGNDDGERLEGDEYEFNEQYSSADMIGGTISVNGDDRWDVEFVVGHYSA